MKIAILGYGKMGKMIEDIALKKGHQIIFKFDYENKEKITVENLKKADIAIEFTQPESAINNIQTCLKAKTPVIVGTTGWYDKLEQVKTACKEHNGAVLYAGNFSIGVNILFSLNQHLAQLMKKQNYAVEIEETHHTEKLDSPSGTAIHLANDIISENDGKEKWVNKKTDKKNELAIISHREKDVTGTHIINYSSAIDEIEIKHEAHNRKGFAQGAVLAAEWLKERKGVYTMKDVLKL